MRAGRRGGRPIRRSVFQQTEADTRMRSGPRGSERRSVPRLEVTGSRVELILTVRISALFNTPGKVSGKVFLEDVVLPAPVLSKRLPRQSIQRLAGHEGESVQALYELVGVRATELLQELVALRTYPIPCCGLTARA